MIGDLPQEVCLAVNVGTYHFWVHLVTIKLRCYVTTDDECTGHATLVTCYQLAYTILKIRFALAQRVGWGRWTGIVMTCCAHGGCFGWL